MFPKPTVFSGYAVRRAMIVCASRRTDIPAFHSEWFMNRLRAGYCLVRNPVSRTTVHKVDLTRKNVDCIEFITKDPRPLVPHLKEMGSMGHVCLFQVTLTPYGKSLEPGVPFKADINDACAEISERIGRDRMVWRYDPVLFNEIADSAYHARKFDMLCGEASAWTDRCVFSFVDEYGRTARGNTRFRGPTPREEDAFLRMAAKTAEKHGMSLSCCCPGKNLSGYGIESRACLDSATLRSLDIPYETSGTPLRKGCGCVRSVDIGDYGTCAHGCVYCYAGRSGPEGTSKLFSPDTELLWGTVMPRDRIADIRGRDSERLEDFRARD